jgi:hypothetical protein
VLIDIHWKTIGFGKRSIKHPFDIGNGNPWDLVGYENHIRFVCLRCHGIPLDFDQHQRMVIGGD